MSTDFRDRCAVVTGAGSGNGRAIASAFAAAGARVVCSDRNLAAAVETVDDLCKQKGNVVMVASVAGIRGVGSHLAYSSSKHAVIGMTRSLALELGPKGVRVNAIAPGTIETPMMTYPGSNLKARGEAFPLRRIGQPEEVAKVVLHLASSEADWTTGLVYVMDGGRTLM